MGVPQKFRSTIGIRWFLSTDMEHFLSAVLRDHKNRCDINQVVSVLTNTIPTQPEPLDSSLPIPLAKCHDQSMFPSCILGTNMNKSSMSMHVNAINISGIIMNNQQTNRRLGRVLRCCCHMPEDLVLGRDTSRFFVGNWGRNCCILEDV